MMLLNQLVINAIGALPHCKRTNVVTRLVTNTKVSN